jgi:ParB family transcriptional regulator, chromosome partitioning protein
MAKLKPVLGRGLAALIPRQTSDVPLTGSTVRHDDGSSHEIIAMVDIDRIQGNPYQPRADFDPGALDELMRSIKEKGVIQPITVRRNEGGYQLISGERRVRASRQAGLRQIPAYIIRVRSDEEMLELALIENLQREHLNPIEIAISYKRLIDECSYTQEEVAQKTGKDRTTVTNFLRLLRLPEAIQSAVRKGELSSGHARALLAIEDPVMLMSAFERTVARGLSVRDVERLVRDRTASKRRRTQPPAGGTSSALESIEDHLRHALGTKVQVKRLRDGRGEIIIEYYSSEDLERIIELLSEGRNR